MFWLGFGIGGALGTVIGYFLMIKLSNTCERYEIIAKAAKNGSKICRQYMNYKYGTWRT